VRRLILASGSRTRRELLAAAGLEFAVVPAEVDEAAVREALVAGGGEIEPADIAEVLARSKAEGVGAHHPDCLVIGADQVLACDGRLYAKPVDMEDARRTLLELGGRTHQLHSAVALADGPQIVWSTTETAHLTMRTLSPAFVGSYLAAVGELACESVGAYQLEGRGIQLFERIEGDYFTILGLPLLPLLAEFRARGVIDA
jgi:septum formation protein